MKGKAGYLLIAVMLMLTGCGNVDWFPAYQRQPTTPDNFSFTQQDEVATGASITSNAITVAGLTAATSPVSITGSVGSNSKYAVNGGTATDAAGTVKNGDSVTVTHTSATTLGTATTSTLLIGNVRGTFTSVTQRVQKFDVTGTGTAGQTVFSGGVTLNIVSGTHTISVANGDYSFDNFLSFFGPASGTRTITINSGQIVYLRNVAAAGSGSKTVTTLTIDGVASTFTTTTQ